MVEGVDGPFLSQVAGSIFACAGCQTGRSLQARRSISTFGRSARQSRQSEDFFKVCFERLAITANVDCQLAEVSIAGSLDRCVLAVSSTLFCHSFRSSGSAPRRSRTSPQPKNNLKSSFLIESYPSNACSAASWTDRASRSIRWL